MRSGVQIDAVITHGRKKKAASGENQEICGGVLKDVVEKPWRTVNTGTTTIVTFRGIYNGKQGQEIFNEEGLDVGVWAVDDGGSVPYASESAI